MHAYVFMCRMSYLCVCVCVRCAFSCYHDHDHCYYYSFQLYCFIRAILCYTRTSFYIPFSYFSVFMLPITKRTNVSNDI